MSGKDEAIIRGQSNIDLEDARFIKEIADQWAQKVTNKLQADLNSPNDPLRNPTPYLAVLNGMSTWLPIFTANVERAILGRVIQANEQTPTSRLAFPKDEREFVIRANGSADLLSHLLPPIYSEQNLKSTMDNFYEGFCRTVLEASRARFNSRGHALGS